MHQDELARVRFSWSGSLSPGLDAHAMDELVHLQKVITLLASEVWKAANPAKPRLPRGFKESTLFSIRAIETEHTEVPIARRHNSHPLLLDSMDRLSDSFGLLHGTLSAANQSRPLPSNTPLTVLPEIAKLGTHLAAETDFHLQTPGQQYVAVSDDTRKGLSRHLPAPSHHTVTVSGNVLEVDVRQGRCQIWDGDSKIVMEFRDEHEAQVLAALNDHDSTTISVEGEETFGIDGYHLAKVDRITFNKNGAQNIEVENQDIHSTIEEIVNSIPDDAWESLPSDLSARHDHYIYGVDQ
ncbi:MAG: hypothetical protein OXC13_15510 [Caldilineaceae bacterium]|nr:hypothetical protein [Caldilineaceae bacterium]